MPKQTSQLDNYIKDFLEYCEIEKNQSQLTIRNYEHYLRRFADYAREHGISKPEDISLDTIRSFRLTLNRMQAADGRNLKLSTQQYHVIAVRAFLKYLIKRDVKTLAPEKIELAKTPGREVSVLDNDEIARLMKALEQEQSEVLRLRDRAILVTLFASGLRISELTSLKIANINLKRGEFTVRGKRLRRLKII